MLQLQRKMRRSRKGVLWCVSGRIAPGMCKVSDFPSFQVSQVDERIDRPLGTVVRPLLSFNENPCTCGLAVMHITISVLAVYVDVV